MTRDGFDYADRSVPWSSVSGVRPAPDDGPRTPDQFVVDLADGAQPITIRLGDLSNGDAFVAVVAMMARGQS